MKKAGRHPSKALNRLVRGFTLIELMIAVAIIGILMAIAIPSYHAYIKRANRAEARQRLQDAALWLQQAATNSATGEYPSSTTIPGWTFPSAMFNVSNGSYLINYAPAASGTAYVLTATRQSGTIQANDECGDYTLTQANVRAIVNASLHMTVDRCWGR